MLISPYSELISSPYSASLRLKSLIALVPTLFIRHGHITNVEARLERLSACGHPFALRRSGAPRCCVHLEPCFPPALEHHHSLRRARQAKCASVTIIDAWTRRASTRDGRQSALATRAHSLPHAVRAPPIPRHAAPPPPPPPRCRTRRTRRHPSSWRAPRARSARGRPRLPARGRSARCARTWSRTPAARPWTTPWSGARGRSRAPSARPASGSRRPGITATTAGRERGAGGDEQLKRSRGAESASRVSHASTRAPPAAAQRQPSAPPAGARFEHPRRPGSSARACQAPPRAWPPSPLRLLVPAAAM